MIWLHFFCDSLSVCSSGYCFGYNYSVQDKITTCADCISVGGDPNKFDLSIWDADTCSSRCQGAIGTICNSAAQSCVYAITNINMCYCGSVFMESSASSENYLIRVLHIIFLLPILLYIFKICV